MNIGFIGCGYVGLSNAAVWARKYKVGIWDTDIEKIHYILKGKLPYQDEDLNSKFKEISKNFVYYNTIEDFIEHYNIFFIAVPTDFDEQREQLNTDILESLIKKIILEKNREKICPVIIVKSTVPVGFTEKIKVKYNYNDIFYIPEFLREGTAYKDCLYPQRIIVGGESQCIKNIIDKYVDNLPNTNKNVILYTSSGEAESIKLFSNAYLAMRVAFFNEVDWFAQRRNFSTYNIINGICKDNRIGEYYNNPSFGYGGYCLPKDTKALAGEYGDSCILPAIIRSNDLRKKNIIEHLISLDKKIGIYKLNMKMESDNMRGSATYDILRQLEKRGIFVAVYDKMCEKMQFKECIKLVNTIEELDSNCDIIIANRMYKELKKISYKVFTRDIYGYN